MSTPRAQVKIMQDNPDSVKSVVITFRNGTVITSNRPYFKEASVEDNIIGRPKYLNFYEEPMMIPTRINMALTLKFVLLADENGNFIWAEFPQPWMFRAGWYVGAAIGAVKACIGKVFSKHD